MISFENEDGYRLGLVVSESSKLRPNGKPYWELRWTLVDDDYPGSAHGILGELLKECAD
jgi:hypothetical protein